mgnify:CR=1 FL=1
MKQYIVLSHQPWLPIPTRTQQLATRLKDAQVLFFEPAGPGPKHRGKQVRPQVFLYTLPPAPTVPERASLLFRRGWRRQSDEIQRAMSRHHMRSPVLWVTSPVHLHLLDFLTYRGLLYDCDLDWSHLPLHWEGDLAAAADVIFAASPYLLDRLSPCNANIALIPNGVNFPMFHRTGLDTPPELSGLPGPVLGWVGTIDSGLDLSPVEYAAKGHPDWHFVLVGEVGENPRLSYLQELPNVHLLGQRPMVDVPDYLDRFDVCLDLQRRRRADGNLIPRRIYEYLSTGKPIVTLLLPEQVEEFPDVVYGAHTLDEYDRMCTRALAEDPAWVSPRRRDYGAAAAWSRRAEEIQHILSGIGLY